MREYILDGLKINSLDEFYIEFANMVHGRSDLGKNFGEPGYFGKNFHAFDDCMFGELIAAKNRKLVGFEMEPVTPKQVAIIIEQMVATYGHLGKKINTINLEKLRADEYQDIQNPLGV